MSNNDEFENPYPKDFGYFRIGTPINADINRFNTDCSAFDMHKLSGGQFLLKDFNATAEHFIQGGGYDVKLQDAWGYSVAAEAGLKSGFITASLSFHINQSENIAKSSSSQIISAWAKQQGGIKLVKNVTLQNILDCATSEFRNKVNAFEEAGTDAHMLEKALANFYKDYGTGFVSKLHLGAIGVFKGTASYKSKSDESKFNIGAGASIGGHVGGTSVAGDFNKQNMYEKAEG